MDLPLFFAEAATQSAHAAPGLTTLFSGAAIVALLTLTLLEIVLGIDNIVFISILSKKLPHPASETARRLGIALAMGLRILLLLSISWIMGLTAAVPIIGHSLDWALGDDKPLSYRDLILFAGGVFLMYKSTVEIHNKLEGEEAHGVAGGAIPRFWSIIVQILMLDIVFSLDSVITAVGMVQTDPSYKWVGLTVMITAVVIAVGVMLFASGPIANFVEKHPTVKMLALSFLLMIGLVLVVDSSHRHIPKGYIYGAMAFSLLVEMLNLKLRSQGSPVHLKQKPPAIVAPAISKSPDAV